MGLGKHQALDVSRRTFIEDSLAAGAMLLGSRIAGVREPHTNAASGSEIPRRIPEKTKQSITTLGMGTCGPGLWRDATVDDIVRMRQIALKSAVRCFDRSRAYGMGEEGVARGLGNRRKKVLLTSTVGGETIAEAERSLSTSHVLLKTDRIDLVYFHNLGMRDMRRALEADEVFPWLVKQKRADNFRFFCISGHSHCERFRRFIEMDESDVLMCTCSSKWLTLHGHYTEGAVRSRQIVMLTTFLAAAVLSGGRLDSAKALGMDSSHAPRRRIERQHNIAPGNSCGSRACLAGSSAKSLPCFTTAQHLASFHRREPTLELPRHDRG